MGFLEKLGIGGSKPPEGGVAQGYDANGNKVEGGAGGVQPNQSPDFLNNATQVAETAPANTETQSPVDPSVELAQVQANREANEAALDTARRADLAGKAGNPEFAAGVPRSEQVTAEDMPAVAVQPTPEVASLGVEEESVAAQASEQLGGVTGDAVKMPEVIPSPSTANDQGQVEGETVPGPAAEVSGENQEKQAA